jgi:hypothetical protein
MRLLEILEGHDVKLTKDLEEDEVPNYVILSHTWGPDEEEVTFKDLKEEGGRHKAGYRKIKFCAEQARRDGHSHFWVDTCCIDKSDPVKLNTAITSMFRWYEKASKCYVYLSDVSAALSGTASGYNASWESEFRSCRWLTRGWTLQELLAPKVVEFYNKSGTRLGDKVTMERLICEISGIPAAALRGRALSAFSIEERFSWQRSRKTKKPEDEAYSLSGICEVSIIPIYGEGRDRAIARLRREIDEIWKGKYI